MPMALTDAPISLSAFSNVASPEPPRRPVKTPKPRPQSTKSVSRRPGREQGIALEHLGHAVEYLIDSRMFLTGIAYTRSEEQALQILMTASREVFESCPAVVPWRIGVGRWFARRWQAMLRVPSQIPR